MNANPVAEDTSADMMDPKILINSDKFPLVAQFIVRVEQRYHRPTHPQEGSPCEGSGLPNHTKDPEFESNRNAFLGVFLVYMSNTP